MESGFIFTLANVHWCLDKINLVRNFIALTSVHVGQF